MRKQAYITKTSEDPYGSCGFYTNMIEAAFKRGYDSGVKQNVSEISQGDLKKMKLTKLEKSWVLYDVANSAFVLLVSTIIPIYFDYLGDLGGISETQYLAYWSYAASVATLVVAVIGPILGTAADRKNTKKPIFTIMLAIGCIGCAALGFMTDWLMFLVVFVIAKIGYSAANVFYDAMLTDVTTDERMDSVSSQGYAFGYIGSCIPFVIGLLFVLMYESIGITMSTAMAIALWITAIWWFVVSLPLLKNYQQTHYVEATPHAVRATFSQLGHTLIDITKKRSILFFYIAFFFYIDGVYTIIEEATAYGTALGLDSTGLLLALLVTQLVAFPCSIIYGILAKKISPEKLISISIVAYTLITLYAVIFLRVQWQFWILAVCVGMFQGGIQALSRSYFGKIIPPEKSGNYFGVLDICGKGASFLGTLTVGVVTQLTGNFSLGVGALVIFFVLGFIFFQISVKERKKEEMAV